MTSKNFDRVYDVIVIGCGASGLAALTKLQKAGLNVLGLEAEDRIGGRVHTVPFGKNVVDLGGQWCDGKTNNIIYEMVKDRQVLAEPSPTQNLFQWPDGTELTSEEQKAFIEKLDKALDNKGTYSKNHSAKCEDMIVSSGTVTLFERLNQLADSSDVETKTIREIASDWPLLNWKDKGFITFLNIEDNGVAYETNKQVESITWGLEAIPGHNGPAALIKCFDGSVYGAKHVITTVSIGVLKERSNFFNPSLPDEKLKLINTLTMSVLDKIYVEFTKPWWQKNFYTTIVGTDGERSKWIKQEQWISDVFAISTVEFQPNVLCLWVDGKGAEAMENESEDNVRKGIEKFLKQFYSGRMTQITNTKRSKWASNPFTRGAYAYGPPKSDAFSTKLYQPLYAGSSPVISFAGEATSVHHGSVHGAIEAGYREAHRIINYTKLSLSKAF